jgi:elongation factor G
MHLGAPATDKVRNVVLVGHGGSGKTSLAEAMLAPRRCHAAGSAASTMSHSNLDFDPEEIRRKNSISLALAPVVHKGVKINIIDTPGYADFMGDAIAGIAAAEMALFVVDAVARPAGPDRASLESSLDRWGSLARSLSTVWTKRMRTSTLSMAALDEQATATASALSRFPMGAEADFHGRHRRDQDEGVHARGRSARRSLTFLRSSRQSPSQREISSPSSSPRLTTRSWRST